jgi:hypothetical protein
MGLRVQDVECIIRVGLVSTMGPGLGFIFFHFLLLATMGGNRRPVIPDSDSYFHVSILFLVS